MEWEIRARGLRREARVLGMFSLNEAVLVYYLRILDGRYDEGMG